MSSALNHVFDNRRESIKRLNEQDFDIFHPTYYNPYFLKYIKTKPYVLTVYDMIHELYRICLEGILLQYKKSK